MSEELPEVPVPSAADSSPSQEVAEIVRALRGLRFGEVRVVVHDGVVVQLERTERRRLQR